MNPEAVRPRILQLDSRAEALRCLQGVGVDPYGIESMLPKMMHFNILIGGMECRVANIVKQEMLSLGGDAAVAREAVGCCIAQTDVVLMGTLKQLLLFADKIAVQPFGLGKIAQRIKEALDAFSRDTCMLQTARREVRLGDRTWIMGILNVTPDSFSDGGRFDSAEAAVAEGLRLVEEGADLIDVGGESSRPGSDPVPLEEELRRVIPVIRGLAKRCPVPISVDTMKAVVAREALAEGAEIVNDISAMTYDGAMAGIVAGSGAAVVLMHMRGLPKTMQAGDLSYGSLMGEVLGFLQERIEAAGRAGISPVRILVDPGIGFGKTPQDNLRLIREQGELKALGRPIVTGPSRKSFIGHVLGGGPAERLEGTAAACTAAILHGSRVLRVHDVAAMKKVARMTDAVMGLAHEAVDHRPGR
jgi:dihydropteroate synthase